MDISCHVWRIPKIPFLLDITVVRARITDFETRLLLPYCNANDFGY